MYSKAPLTPRNGKNIFHHERKSRRRITNINYSSNRKQLFTSLQKIDRHAYNSIVVEYRRFFSSKDREAAGTRTDSACFPWICRVEKSRGLAVNLLSVSKTILFRYHQNKRPIKIKRTMELLCTTNGLRPKVLTEFSCWYIILRPHLFSPSLPPVHHTHTHTLSLSLLLFFLRQCLSLFYQQTFVCVLSLTILTFHTLYAVLYI